MHLKTVLFRIGKTRRDADIGDNPLMYFRARLAQTGEDVTFIARGRHLKAIPAAGLRYVCDITRTFRLLGSSRSELVETTTNFEGETIESRLARRRHNWTPEAVQR